MVRLTTRPSVLRMAYNGVKTALVGVGVGVGKEVGVGKGVGVNGWMIR